MDGGDVTEMDKDWGKVRVSGMRESKGAEIKRPILDASQTCR